MPLAMTLEVIEAIETLKGNGPEDFRELCLSLGALALVAAKKSPSEAEPGKPWKSYCPVVWH